MTCAAPTGRKSAIDIVAVEPQPHKNASIIVWRPDYFGDNFQRAQAILPL
jgi:hypothetical protein